ncbi:MAG TPA: dihydroorotase [Chitinophagaceae bacterium]|nr:dihydroorotase [Chitinophagaceae bacterium]
MNLLLRQARVVDPSSPFHDQVLDILIQDARITRIGKKLDGGDARIIEAKGLCVSPGWVDVFADFADPGFEFKETLRSGSEAAAAGGFTDVFVIPNTSPVLHNKAGIEYVVQGSRDLPVRIHPIGAISRNCEGKELAEMYDMRQSGAIAFSDGIKCVQSSGLLLKALQYVKAVEGVVIQLPDDHSVNPQGLMNEGVASTRLGLPGKPLMAEELIIARDISLARYAESRIHFTGVSGKKSIDLIHAAKENDYVTCSVTPHHLFFTDEDLGNYDSNLKVNPPLRSEKERNALRESLRNGTVDCIATHHLPHEADSKMVEFEYARFGMLGLETAFAALQTAVPELNPEHWVRLLSINPRRIFGLDLLSIAGGQPACLTLFLPDATWKVSESDFRSRSQNSAFIGQELRGRVLGIINKDQVFLKE